MNCHTTSSSSSSNERKNEKFDYVDENSSVKGITISYNEDNGRSSGDEDEDSERKRIIGVRGLKTFQLKE